MDPAFARDIVISLLFTVFGTALGRYEDVWGFVRRIFASGEAQNPLVGPWHTYHFTRDEQGSPFLRYEKWDIYMNRFGQMRLGTSDPNRPLFRYEGTVTIERGHAIFDLHGKHSEKWQASASMPYPGSRLFLGLFASPDFGDEHYATIKLFSKEKLSTEDASRMIRDRASYAEQEVGLRIRKA